MEKLEDNKFAHLLQPIRDLAANWDINIANELEDYMDVLESVTFSFEGGPNLNFAEAALLIQGSACVYGKKVEYLHTLVYQALEFIAEKKRRASKGLSSQQAADTDDLDDEEQFLNLDDVLEEGTAIDMDQTSTTAIPAAVRPPAVLLALESTSSATGGDGDAGNYRIASCSMHHSGALLLEARDGEFLDEQLCYTNIAATTHLQQPDQQVRPMPEDASHDAMDTGNAEGYDGAEGCSHDFDGCGDGDDGVDYMQQEAAHLDHAGMPDQPQHFLQSSSSQQAAQLQEEDQEEEEFDPYAPLDPHVEGTLPIKPFKKGRKPTRRKRPKQADCQDVDALGCTLGTIPAPTVSGCTFAEFNYALKLLQSSQQAQRLAAVRQMATTRGHKEAQLGSAFTREEAAAGCADLDDEEDCAGGYVSGGMSDRGSEPGHNFPQDSMAELDEWAELAGAGDRAFASNGPPADGDADSMSYEELCQAHIEAFIQAAAAAEVQTELASRVSNWRYKIQPLLDEQDARPAFDIHLYGDQVLDKLARLSCRDPDHPVELQTSMVEPVGFEAVAGEESQAEVSRLFSAMLQLINNGNIQILPGQAQQPFQLRLLKTELLHRQFLEGPAITAHASKADHKDLSSPLHDKSNVNSPKAVKGVKRRNAID
ncbi:MAG: condensin-2 complex subunit H2 [Trebouxia sp. A1-2]|nr:MAG: condensin-2 complex subunit H2 [Trebouxia sp. A1-2]